MTPEAKARVTIDALLMSAGWHVSIIREAEVGANLKRAQALWRATLVRAFALDQ